MFAYIKRHWKRLGPGLVTGASDDDPSGIATYSQTGAQFGYTPLWMPVFMLPLMISIQEMCARIGIATGQGLVKNFRRHFSPSVIAGCIFLLALANMLNLGADLGMMAAAAELLVPFPFLVWLFLFVGITLVLQIGLPYKVYARYLKWLTLVLFFYIIVAASIHVPWTNALGSTFFPRFLARKDFLLIIVALLGTTISPYLYFWQTDQEMEEHRRTGRKRLLSSRQRLPIELKHSFLDVVTGMTFSNIVSWFIILTAAAVLHTQGITQIQTADDAARVLAPLAGRFASTIFALGIIGMGLLAVPILSGVIAYALSELAGIREGLHSTWKQARWFYVMIVVSTFLGACVNFLEIGPVRLLIYSAIVNAMVAPPLLYGILRVANDAEQMRGHVNGRWSNIFGWITFVVMSGASFVALRFFLFS